MTLDQDAEAVYRALQASSPQDASELARASGVHGRRLEQAMDALEETGLAEREHETGEDVSGYSFSYARRLT